MAPATAHNRQALKGSARRLPLASVAAASLLLATALIGCADAQITVGGQTYFDMHMVLPYAQAQEQCKAQAGATATYVSFTNQNQTGSQLCGREKYGHSQCAAALYVYQAVDGSTHFVKDHNQPCDINLERPFWPWGFETFQIPTTASTEWVRRSYVLCCR